MEHGDFTELAKFYGNRPGYSKVILEYLKNNIIQKFGEDLKAADIGAGTGKLTENLSELGLTGYAVEPNEAMRAEGMKVFKENTSFSWLAGSAETTNLPDSSVDWVLMGSSFHWTDYTQSMKEFQRILKPEGYFTAIWNPRDIESSKLHISIEEAVYTEIPGIKRVSSGKSINTQEIKEKLLFQDLFEDMIFMEAPHYEIMSKERYINTWKSVNDIQVQAGEDGFKRILSKIEKLIENMETIIVPYQSRAWTVKSCKK